MTSGYLSDSDSSFSSTKSSECSDLPAIASLSPTKRSKTESTPSPGEPVDQGRPSVVNPSTPTKQNRHLSADGMKTPEGKYASTSGLTVSQSCMVDADSHSYISPLRSEEVSKIGKQRDVRKVEKFTKEFKAKVEMNEKTAHYKKTGGVRALTQNWEEKRKKQSSSEASERGSESCVPSSTSSFEMAVKMNTSSGDHDESPPFPIRAPGMTLFVKPPQLITELYPPGFIESDTSDKDTFSGIEQSMIMQESPEELITAGWLQMIYQQKACPLSIWQWLFHIMGKSSDIFICDGALQTLQSLVIAAQKRNDTASIHPPYAEEVIDVLVELGANRDFLHLERDCSMDTDEVFTRPKPPIANITFLLRYLATCAKVLPRHYSRQDIHCLIIALLHVCLDPHICGELIETDIGSCIGSLVSALPEDYWIDDAAKIAFKISTISDHHHNKLHLALLFNGIATTERQRVLQGLVCKYSIVELLGPESKEEPLPSLTSSNGDEPKAQNTASAPNEECALSVYRYYPGKDENCNVMFVWEVVNHFHRMNTKAIDYYEMFSVMNLLVKFMSLEHIEWPEGEKKRFAQDLEKLSTKKLRDDVNFPERGPVKDLVFRLKLDLGTQKKMKQPDIYSFMQ